ncbi:hypothetical protein ACFCZQ_09785 [Streptomyces virginiae]|uniref:hypothetical protein n=1 Tax=Streptomyces virginiae TaxID=1961 RepID=UPI0035D67045
MPLDAARSLGKLARDNSCEGREQLAWWADEQKQRSAASAERSAAKKASEASVVPTPLVDVKAVAAPEPEQFYGRKTVPVSAAPDAPPVAAPEVSSKSVGEGTAHLPTSVDLASHENPVPVPRPATHEADTAVATPPDPWHSGAAVMDAAISNLSPSERSNFILRYFHVSSGVEAVIEDMRGTLAAGDRNSLAVILQ